MKPIGLSDVPQLSGWTLGGSPGVVFHQVGRGMCPAAALTPAKARTRLSHLLIFIRVIWGDKSRSSFPGSPARQSKHFPVPF